MRSGIHSILRSSEAMRSVSLSSATPNRLNGLALFEPGLLAAWMALVVLAVLVTSDTTAESGMFVPQAAGWGLLAMALSLIIHLARHYRTLDAGHIRDLRG